MFNGIVETIGTIHSLRRMDECLILHIIPQAKWHDVVVGESIAVNGVCLTVTELLDDGFLFTVVPETLRLTNLPFLKVNSHVNLERALRVGDRISGHHVEGHVQGLATIQRIQHEGNAWLIDLCADADVMNGILPKGYVCLDGMSITVIDQNENHFSVTLIPHTLQVTIAHQYQVGDRLNLETDIFLRILYKQNEERQDALLSRSR